jgi:peptide/nickel transport system substrate-binding protein
MHRTILAVLAAAVMGAPITAMAAPRLVLAVGGEPDGGFDPIMGWGRYGSPLFQATLLKLDPSLELVGDLATDWRLSDDRLTWTVNIRTDARFSDGTPLTAEDVAFTYNTARDAGGLTDLKALREARVVDADTVALELREPRITFLHQMAALGIVPANRYGPGYGREPLGAGPFRMVEWREGEQLVVEPNPHWHGGEIGFERISFVFGTEQAGMALAQTGAAQLVAVPPAQASAPPAGMRTLAVETVDNRGLMFPMLPDEGRLTAEGVPIGNSVTADRAIRVAINQALDREALVMLALDDRGRPAWGPADGLPWDNPEARLTETGLETALATLEAAGWTDRDGDGVREKDGQRAAFRIVYPASDSTRQALALGAASQLRAIGIAAEPAGESWDRIARLKHSEVVVFGWGAHDPSEIYNLHHGDNAGAAWWNPGFYDNPAVNAHFDAAMAAESFADALPHWRAAQWDGETGYGPRGDAAWAWLVNLEHVYWVDDCLDPGPMQIHPHGHGFPITHGLPSWRWTCG